MMEIRMPRLSESMTEGKLLLWNVAVGDFVEPGDQLAEIEADKANMEIEAPVAGIVCNIHGNPGDKIPVDAVLVELKEELSHETKKPTGASVVQPTAANDPTPQVESPLERRQKQFTENQEDKA